MAMQSSAAWRSDSNLRVVLVLNDRAAGEGDECGGKPHGLDVGRLVCAMAPAAWFCARHDRGHRRSPMDVGVATCQARLAQQVSAAIFDRGERGQGVDTEIIDSATQLQGDLALEPAGAQLLAGPA
jgi:hypothetical protein